MLFIASLVGQIKEERSGGIYEQDGPTDLMTYWMLRIGVG